MSPQKTRKRKTLDPCAICFMHKERCICHHIPKLKLKTRLSLVIHHRELKRTTNTGRLAVQALQNSQMLIRGLEAKPLNLSQILSEEYDSYVLYPSEDSLELETIKPSRPVQLIVSDGNWRQAGKLQLRHPEIAHLPRVRISEVNLGLHHLRSEHMDNGFSTLEAIAIAFGIFESVEVKEQLMDLYRAKLFATLKGRGVF